MRKEKLNVALIGCGEIADFHLQGVLAKKELYLYAVCDPAADDRLQRRKEPYGAELAVRDYRELVNDPRVDLVIIAAPDQLHTEMTVAFLHAGKDVLLEKPMALSLEECETMLRAEQESGRCLMVGQVCRYNHNFVQAKALLDQGWNVTDTAMALGFSGSDYFSVVFRRYTLLSPTEYQRRSRCTGEDVPR